MIKILMVCLGNICRSPLAEGILKSKVNSNRIEVDSAGTSDSHEGELPDFRSIEVAQEHGLDITNQRSRPFKKEDFDKFDYIYVMDQSNYSNVVKLASNESDINKVKLILNELLPEENQEVPDPYYGGASGFENVYQMLDKACQVIVKKIN